MADQLWNKGGEDEEEEGSPFYYPFLPQNGNPLNSPTIKLKVLRISLVSLSLGCEAGAHTLALESQNPYRVIVNILRVHFVGNRFYCHFILSQCAIHISPVPV